MPTFFKYLCECETEAAKEANSYLKVILKRCLSVYFLVPSAHLAFVTAPPWPERGCAPSQPPISTRWESRVMTTAAAAPRTTGNMAAGFLCSTLEIASCGPDTFSDFSEDKKTKGRPVARHLYHYEVMSAETLIYVSPPVLHQSWQTLDESINDIPLILSARFLLHVFLFSVYISPLTFSIVRHMLPF